MNFLHTLCSNDPHRAMLHCWAWLYLDISGAFLSLVNFSRCWDVSDRRDFPLCCKRSFREETHWPSLVFCIFLSWGGVLLFPVGIFFYRLRPAGAVWLSLGSSGCGSRGRRAILAAFVSFCLLLDLPRSQPSSKLCLLLSITGLSF